MFCSKTNLNSDFRIDFDLKLGEGYSGEIFKGICLSTQSFVTIQKIKEQIPNAREVINTETNIINNIKHQNVITTRGLLECSLGIFCIKQYFSEESLEDQIRTGIHWFKCLFYLKQIVDGMCAVNRAHYIHRNIIPQNILIGESNTIKIDDFQLSTKILGDDPNKLQQYSVVGTPIYTSPQILKHQKYSAKCDVWSTGVLLVQMLTQKNPFCAAHNFSSLIKTQQRLKDTPYVLEGNYKPWFKEILTHMIEYDEQKRWSFYELQEAIEQEYQRVMKQQQVKHDELLTTIKKQPCLNKFQSRRLVSNFKSYTQFIYNRGKLFTDVATKYFQSIQNLKEKAYKLIVLFLSIAIFLKSLEKIQRLMHESKLIVLPDKVSIEYDTLHQQSKHQFLLMKQRYLNKIETERQKFLPTVKQIHSKLFSEKYKYQYSKLLDAHQDILGELYYMSRDQYTKPVEYFQKKFKEFFMMECLEKSVDNLHDDYLRVYCVCLKLTKVDEVLPLSKYNEKGIEDKFQIYLQTTQIVTIKEQLSQLS